jgi:hypothetical protein
VRLYIFKIYNVLYLSLWFDVCWLSVSDLYMLFNNPCGLSSSFHFAFSPTFTSSPHGPELGKFHVLIDFSFIVVSNRSDLVDAVEIVFVIIVSKSFGVIVDFDFGS